MVTETKTDSNQQGKLVFLVDEIDRCLPNEQLMILERIHHLLNIPNCAVLCAINAQCIADNVKTVYGIDGNEYLKKFFDFTYYLSTSADIYCKKLFDSFEESAKKIRSNINWDQSPVAMTYECLLYGKKDILKKTKQEVR